MPHCCYFICELQDDASLVKCEACDSYLHRACQEEYWRRLNCPQPDAILCQECTCEQPSSGTGGAARSSPSHAAMAAVAETPSLAVGARSTTAVTPYDTTPAPSSAGAFSATISTFGTADTDRTARNRAPDITTLRRQLSSADMALKLDTNIEGKREWRQSRIYTLDLVVAPGISAVANHPMSRRTYPVQDGIV